MSNKNEKLIKAFKEDLIKQISNEAEREIQLRVKDFEQKLREMTSVKIVSFVDSLKLVVKEELNSYEPKIIIEVHYE